MIAYLTLLLPAVVAAAGSCPDVRPLEGLDLAEWTRASWYIAEQQINGYQSEEDLFCVVATYLNRTEEKKSVPFFSGTVLSVHNYENKNHTNGPVDSTDKNIPSGLCARAKNSSYPSELLVAPCFLPNFAGGPYWVIAFNKTYEWGVIAGGTPTVQYNDGCSTKETGVNGSGLWIFVRDPTNSEMAVSEARIALKKLGYSLSRLLDVKQDGCKYDGARIKN